MDVPRISNGTALLLLLILHGRRDRGAHGLLMALQLSISSSATYRALRQLEEDGLVVSTPEEPETPPARALRRQYRITGAGVEVVRMLCSLAGVLVPDRLQEQS